MGICVRLRREVFLLPSMRLTSIRKIQRKLKETSLRASPLLHGWTAGMEETTAAVEVESREFMEAARTPLDERVGYTKVTLRTCANLLFSLLLEGSDFHRVHKTTCETSPPTAKATTHVPAQITSPSFHPLSFIITITDAMHGTNSVMTINAIVICIGERAI